MDESLHTGMTLIKQEIIKDIDADYFPKRQYAQLAIKLDTPLAYLLKIVNCQPKQMHNYIFHLQKWLRVLRLLSKKVIENRVLY
jgi:hypothetical protein